MQLASELDRRRILQIVRENLHPPRRVFIGVIDPINPKVESPQEVRDRVLEASDFIPLIQLGTTDDCGFSPLLATIFRRPEKPPLQRFVHASKEPSLQWNSLDKFVGI